MINRILIRIKVVQMLYSYLLTRSEFKIDNAPETTSRDKKFGYAVYTDLLLLLLELSDCRVSRSEGRQPAIDVDPKLRANRVGRSLLENDTLKSIILRGNTDIAAFDQYLQKIHDKITSSEVFGDYRKKRKLSLADDVELWITVVKSIIAKEPMVESALRTNPDFTNIGFNLGVKQLVATLESFSDTRVSYLNARKDLQASLDKAYELYNGVFVLMSELTELQEQRIENNKAKYLATAEDLNPNMRFVNNEFVAALRDNQSLQLYLADHPITWNDDPIMMDKVLNKIVASPIYEEYMSAPSTDFEADCDFWRNILKSVVLPADELSDYMEEKSVYWNDDLQIMGTFVLKTIKQFAAAKSASVELLPQFKDEEDAKFGVELFDFAVQSREQYRAYIDSFIDSTQWDPERLAFMDIVIMITAIAELIHYPSIPVPVTMNEYIEIANSYSTDKSGQFINGILFSVIRKLSEEGIIAKPIAQDNKK
jgi:N utilization substance protein B